MNSNKLSKTVSLLILSCLAQVNAKGRTTINPPVGVESTSAPPSVGINNKEIIGISCACVALFLILLVAFVPKLRSGFFNILLCFDNSQSGREKIPTTIVKKYPVNNNQQNGLDIESQQQEQQMPTLKKEIGKLNLIMVQKNNKSVSIKVDFAKGTKDLKASIYKKYPVEASRQIKLVFKGIEVLDSFTSLSSGGLKINDEVRVVFV